ncbi:trehalose/maltose hydrolase-like predicted phosphorylase [Pontibacter ummariensis]|uniref:Trehalose and maltose hydrolase (Possible phosphorylase) n=1 Tax=Pontibacter ummariensis TaxID=1610492 RepID=A0A239KIK9_9BACT|nr:glycoside hydrolase family 65 protein [Pontibacter ummariensis]PRY06423.1 trehalose/maltose hydrolase-like predicted phosphorylase [Pontibacter ummariensis]SNT16984.1 Trehalose and maltose hydrolase (possible phosphorylase) [Pontibacter ummariensis]
MRDRNKEVIHNWCIHFDHYDPADEGRREALMALGNGCLVSRAAAPESQDDRIHYPGTYRVGCYNELTSHIQGQEVKNESMVNLPNWLPLTFRLDKGDWFSLDKVQLQAYEQTLHLQQGLLTRMVRFRDQQGRETLLQERRFVSMAQPNLMALSLELTAVNWSGDLEVCTGLDGNIINNNVKRYAPYNRHHLETQHAGTWGEDNLELLAQTNQSHSTIALAARTRLQVNGRTGTGTRTSKTEPQRVSSYLHVPLREGDMAGIEKVAALYTSLDLPAAECRQAAREAVQTADNFDVLFQAHRSAWAQLWQRCQIEMDNTEQLCYARLHIFHLLQNFSPHTTEMDVGVPPSGWQGEEYHGQVFWDELFVFPFLTFHFPASARALLHYRYRRLEAARQLAAQQGYRGAMFPWRSASDGEEETPPIQLNLLSGHWMVDNTCLQRHVGAAIAYNIWYYAQVTGDQSFLEDYGAELFLEIARFWASVAQYNASLDRYEIQGVVGPDEYHTQYPNAPAPGIRNNTYTNVMAAWVLRQVPEVLEQLSSQRQQELQKKLSLGTDELAQWDRISRKLRVVFLEDGTLSQFEGFEQLQKLDLEAFRKQHGQHRLDWTLYAMGDSVERYQVSKQADTPLLLYLFSPEELIRLFDHLGYTLSTDTLKRTLTRHLSHAAHESTLSRIVFAGALAALDPTASWHIFDQTQQVDLSPKDKGTAEGIHLGAMAGTLTMLQHHYLGLKVRSGILEAEPSLPAALGWVRMALYFRGEELLCEATHHSARLRSLEHV